VVSSGNGWNAGQKDAISLRLHSNASVGYCLLDEFRAAYCGRQRAPPHRFRRVPARLVPYGPFLLSAERSLQALREAARKNRRAKRSSLTHEMHLLDIYSTGRHNRNMFPKLVAGLLAGMAVQCLDARTVRIAVCQILAIDGDREGNFRRIEYALETARAGRADIATFPESVILGWENPQAHQMATPIPGADSDRIAALAVKYGLMISIGLDEKDGSRLFDSAILVDRTGKILWRHRKLNVLAQLMDPPYAEGVPDGIGSVKTEFGQIGIVICADTMVEAYADRVAQLKPKPDLMSIPYGWAAEVDRWPGHAKNLERLVVGRAKMWNTPVVATDLVGVMMHGPWTGQTYGGASVAADSAGNVLAVLRDRDVDVCVVDVPVGNAARSPFPQ
jgi:predicted amidohydrolase